MFARRNRRGALAPLAAVLMVVLFGMVAFVVDIGYITKTQQELQTAADAAALAGGQQLMSRNQLSSGSYDANAVYSAAQTAAINCALLNKSANVSVALLSADAACGNIVIPSDPTSPFTTAAPYNAMQVTTRRDGSANGSLTLFFAGFLGVNTANLQATATAVYDGNVQGFRIPPSSSKTSSLLPFALDINTWNAAFTSGSDAFSYNPTTEQVNSGSDNVKEVRLYPYQNLTSGNFGTVNLGNSSNSTSTLNRQIMNGPNATDMASLGGQIALGENGTLSLAGNPGLSAGIESALQSIIGQPRTILLYQSVGGNGSNANYTIVGFAGIVITEATLTGLHKGITVQPEFVQDATAFTGASSPSQFVYTALQLCR